MATLRIKKNRWIWVAATAVLLFVVAGVCFTLMRSISAPSKLDYGISQTSEQSRFHVVYQAEAIHINSMHEWTIHVEDVNGQIVENAQITVDGGMPQHGHGLPTAPQVTEYLGDGNYRVEGMKFQMPGWWIVSFHINADGVEDVVTFNLNL